MKIRNQSHSNISFKLNRLSQVDIAYKKLIQQGLKDSYGIKCKISDLNSITGPDELKSIITKLKPYQYEVGDNFRANFHIHTNASDGKFSAKEFLECCKEWADNIFKLGKTNDGLPPFSSAITDHCVVDNVKEAIAEISQNPDKYKNFKFISGCEFLFDGYQKPYSAFEAVGLGFNPFDKDLQPIVSSLLRQSDIKEAQKVTKAGGILSWAHPIYTPNKIEEDNFFRFLKANGINGVEGNYQYIHSDKDYINAIKPMLDKQIKKFDMFVTGGTDSHKKSLW